MDLQITIQWNSEHNTATFEFSLNGARLSAEQSLEFIEETTSKQSADSWAYRLVQSTIEIFHGEGRRQTGYLEQDLICVKVYTAAAILEWLPPKFIGHFNTNSPTSTIQTEWMACPIPLFEFLQFAR